MRRPGWTILAAVSAAMLALAAVFASGNPKGETQMETGSVAGEFLGKSFEDVQERLGAPIQEDRFTLGLDVLEFRVELTNFFDETRRRENPPDIREATWSLSPEENLTLWFTRTEGGSGWQALHFISWHPGDQF